MSLLPLSMYSDIFLPLVGKKIGYIQGHYGNAGDGLIHHGTLQLFSHFGIDYQIVNPSVNDNVCRDVEELVFFGGGNMNYEASRSIRKAFYNSPLKKTILPQSWTRFHDEPMYDRIFAREKYSLALCPTANLAPDIGLAYTYNKPIPEPVRGIGIFMRGDQESKFKMYQFPDPCKGLTHLDAEKYVEEAAIYKTIITDRLHFAICGLICSRQVFLMPNNYHKNLGMYEAWLKDLGCKWRVEMEMMS